MSAGDALKGKNNRFGSITHQFKAKRKSQAFLAVVKEIPISCYHRFDCAEDPTPDLIVQVAEFQKMLNGQEPSKGRKLECGIVTFA